MLAQIAALYPNVTVSVSNKRQAFDLTYNGKLVWNGSSMGPPRALKFDILGTGALAAAMAKAK